jgi:hypothetical protein
MAKSNEADKNVVTVEFELKARRQKAFRCYARTLRELEECETFLRDTWASLSAIRSLIQEQTAVMTSSAEIFEV